VNGEDARRGFVISKCVVMIVGLWEWFCYAEALYRVLGLVADDMLFIHPESRQRSAHEAYLVVSPS
jgi:hypothetical protein